MIILILYILVIIARSPITCMVSMHLSSVKDDFLYQTASHCQDPICDWHLLLLCIRCLAIHYPSTTTDIALSPLVAGTLYSIRGKA